MGFPESLRSYVLHLRDKYTSENYELQGAVPFNIVVLSLLRTPVSTARQVETYLANVGYPDGSTSDRLADRIKDTYIPMIDVPFSSTTRTQELDVCTSAICALLRSQKEFHPCIESALNEIFGNVQTHSRASRIRYMAQRWGNRIELVIFDNGTGFMQSLNAISEIQALINAIEHGFSSRKDSKTGGQGIQTLKRMTLNPLSRGEFLIMSNDSVHMTRWENEREEIEMITMPFSIKGSLIALRINNTAGDFQPVYEDMLNPKYVTQNPANASTVNIR